MPTNFTVVPVEARADGAQEEAAEPNEAPGPPEGGEPEEAGVDSRFDPGYTDQAPAPKFPGDDSEQ